MTQLPRTLVTQILQHAQSTPDLEVCGLIGAYAGNPTRAYPVRNAADTPECLFRMDAKEQIDALRHMRDSGEELFGIYHSHPHGPAHPSAIDLQEAGYPEALYLIVSLNTKGVLEMRGYRLRAGAAEEVALELR